MERNPVTVMFDRKNVAVKRGKGTIEIRVIFSRTEKKHIKIGECTPLEWPKVMKSADVKKQKEYYETIVNSMITINEELTVENLNAHLGIKVAKEEKNTAKMNFLDWLRDTIKEQNLRPNTVRQKMVTLDALTDFGKIKLFCDLTPTNLYAFDSWLREKGNRTDVTVFNYHRRLKPYIKLAYQLGMIDQDPYSRCKFNRGKSKERKPLTEQELKKVREIELPLKLDRVRDLFVFSAYTGLAYCDVMEFDFKTMTEEFEGMYYIDGERIKTGSGFFTPILPPALEILKKYNYKLPRITNQKGNDYLHVVEAKAEIKKPMTFHVARHSFATLALAHDIPIDKVARMMGHKNIKTTQIYAKVLKTSVATHGASLAKGLL